MRRILAFGAVALVVFLAACDPGSGNANGIDASGIFSDKPVLDGNGHPLLLPNSDPAVEKFETELLRLVNDYRMVMNLKPLTASSRLSDAARAHARHMIEHRFISHVSPEGLLPGERLALLHVDWTAAAENIASAFSTPQDVFDAWLKSPTHRANIESTRFTYAGVGYALDAAPTAEFADVHYWAMAFVER
jgi:uncharacterized protein YkwD